MRNLLLKSEVYPSFDEPSERAGESRSVSSGGRRTLVLTCLLLAISFLALIPGAVSRAPEADEGHWRSRSAVLLGRIREGKFDHLTTHLPHPGIPGAFAMASGQFCAHKWNALGGHEEGDPWHLDDLSGARIAAAFVASLFVGIVFLFARPLFGTPIAFVASFLFALDPYFIGVSRQAHIDASLSLFMSLSVLSFVWASCRDSIPLSLLSGLSWGLALAGKPTAVLLLPVFLSIRVLRFLSGEQRRLVFWRDCWSLCLGLATFTLLYSRLWYRWTSEKFRLNPWQGAPIWLDEITPLLNTMSVPLLLAPGIIGALLYWYERRAPTRSALVRGVLHTAFLLSLLGLSLILRPELARNFTGYGAWVLGLSKTAHVAYGRVWDPPPHGYPGFLFSKLPELILLGLGLSLFVLVRFFKEARVRDCIALGLACVFVILGLSVSSKQAYRYLLPILPLIYIIAVFSYVRVVLLLPRRFRKGASVAVFALLLISQLLIHLNWRQAPELYNNWISGGLAHAMESGVAHSFAGQKEVIDWLQAESVRLQRPIKVGVIGDFRTLQSGYLRLYPRRVRQDESSVRFSNLIEFDTGEYIVLYHSIPRRMGKKSLDIESQEALMRFVVDGVPIVSIYKPIPPDNEQGLNFALTNIPRRTGKVYQRKDDSGLEVLGADPRRDSKDYIFYNTYVRVLPGKYQLRLNVHATELPEAFDPSRYALRLELGSECQKVVRVKSLAEADLIQLDCSFKEDLYLQLRAYWFGYAPIEIEKIQIKRAP